MSDRKDGPFCDVPGCASEEEGRSGSVKCVRDNCSRLCEVNQDGEMASELYITAWESF